MPSISRSVSTAVSATCLLLACADSSGRATSSRTAWQVDSTRAGDTTILRVSGTGSPEAEVRLVRESAFGSVAGTPEETFAHVSSMVLTSNGELVVYDAGARQVRRYDTSGTFLHNIGTRGQGPGEYRTVSSMAAGPDGSVGVWDLSGTHILLFGRDGNLVADSRLPSRNEVSYRTGPGLIDADGTFLTQIQVPWTLDDDTLSVNGNPRTTYALLRTGTDGSILDTILAPPQPQRIDFTIMKFNAAGNGSGLFVAKPFARRFLNELAPDARYVTAMTGQYSLTLHGLDMPRRVEADIPAVPIALEQREAALEEYNETARVFDPSSVMTVDKVPEFRPPIAGIHFDADGRIWVRLAQPSVLVPAAEAGFRAVGGTAVPPPPSGFVAVEAVQASGGSPPTPKDQWVDPFVYDVYDPDGMFLGRVKLPERTVFGAASADKLWLVARDELDVESIVRFRMENAEWRE